MVGMPVARTHPLDVHEHAQDPDLLGVADGLLHQAEARTAGGGEGLGPGRRGADDCVRARDLLLRLQEAELEVLSRPARGDVQDLGRRADRVAGVVAAPAARLPAAPPGRPWVSLPRLSGLSPARRGRRWPPGSSRWPGQASTVHRAAQDAVLLLDDGVVAQGRRSFRQMSTQMSHRLPNTRVPADVLVVDPATPSWWSLDVPLPKPMAGGRVSEESWAVDDRPMPSDAGGPGRATPCSPTTGGLLGSWPRISPPGLAVVWTFAIPSEIASSRSASVMPRADR